MLWIGGGNTSKTSLIPPTRLPARKPGSGMGSLISGVEAAEVVKKLLGPGVDEICLEFLKALDCHG